MILYPTTEHDVSANAWSTDDGRVFTMIGGALLVMKRDEARKLADELLLLVAKIDAHDKVGKA